MITEYFSEASKPETTLAWDSHLYNCRDCGALFNTYKKTIEILRSLPWREISPEARERIRRAIRKRITHPCPTC